MTAVAKRISVLVSKALRQDSQTINQALFCKNMVLGSENTLVIVVSRHDPDYELNLSIS